MRHLNSSLEAVVLLVADSYSFLAETWHERDEDDQTVRQNKKERERDRIERFCPHVPLCSTVELIYFLFW